MEPSFTIGGLAREAGVSVETVRYYERRGLLEQPPRGTGYRRYSGEDVARLRFVRRAKDLGFTLSEVRDLIGAAGCGSAAAVAEAARAKLAQVDEQRAALDRLRDRLDALVRTCETGDEGCVGLEATAQAG